MHKFQITRVIYTPMYSRIALTALIVGACSTSNPKPESIPQTRRPVYAPAPRPEPVVERAPPIPYRAGGAWTVDSTRNYLRTKHIRYTDITDVHNRAADIVAARRGVISLRPTTGGYERINHATLKLRSRSELDTAFIYLNPVRDNQITPLEVRAAEAQLLYVLNTEVSESMLRRGLNVNDPRLGTAIRSRLQARTHNYFARNPRSLTAVRTTLPPLQKRWLEEITLQLSRRR
jgi:hypothetical protein